MKTKTLTLKNREVIFEKIKKLIQKMDMLRSVTFFFNNKRIMYKCDSTVVIEEDMKATDYCDYANDDTLTVVFDGGDLWEVLNCSFGYSMKDEFDSKMEKILKPYNLYYEMGNSWNFSLFDSE